MNEKAYIFDEAEGCPAGIFRNYMGYLFTNGTFEDGMTVSVAGGMNLEVAVGYVHVNGAVRYFGTPQSLSLQASSSGGDRIDSVVVECDENERRIDVKVVQGESAAENPTVPDPIRTDGKYQLVIARISIRRGVTEITSEDITDTRGDASLCGFVSGRNREVDFTQVTRMFSARQADELDEYLAEFDEWYETTYVPNASITDEDKAKIERIVADANAYSNQVRNVDIPKISSDITTLIGTMDSIIESGSAADSLFMDVDKGDAITIKNSDYDRADFMILTVKVPGTLGKNSCFYDGGRATIFAMRDYGTDGTRTNVFKAWGGINSAKASSYTNNSKRYYRGYFALLVNHMDITFSQDTASGNWTLSQISIKALLKEFHYGANSTSDTSADNTGNITQLSTFTSAGIQPRTYGSVTDFNAACSNISAPDVPFTIKSVQVLLAR